MFGREKTPNKENILISKKCMTYSEDEKYELTYVFWEITEKIQIYTRILRNYRKKYKFTRVLCKIIKKNGKNILKKIFISKINLWLTTEKGKKCTCIIEIFHKKCMSNKKDKNHIDITQNYHKKIKTIKKKNEYPIDIMQN